MRHPTISICLPSLNTAPFIEARIQSIEAQTFRDFEVLVVDSYSTDGTWEALHNWSSGHAQIRAKQIPRGLYQAWNHCIAETSGDWLYFATSDDIMAPDCLQKLLCAGQASAVDIVTSDEWMIDSQANNLSSKKSTLEAALLAKALGRDHLVNGRIRFLAGLLFGTPTASITQMMIHRRVFELGGGFPTEYGSFGDYSWQMRSLLRFRWCHVPEKLGAWRIHGAQATTNDVQKIYDARVRIISELWRQGLVPNKIWFRLAMAYVGAMSQTADLTELPPIVRRLANPLRRCPSMIRSAFRRLLCLPPAGVLDRLLRDNR